jgi:hypothetical protein
MSDLTVDRTTNGWQTNDGDLLILAQSPHLDRGSVKAALSVRRNGTLLWTQNVNLTSDISRKRFIQAVRQKEAEVREGVLLALEEVCRQRRWVKANDAPPSDFSEKVPITSWTEMEAVVRKWLLISDPGVLRIMLGTLLAHRFGGDPVWMFLIAPPGGAKTELLRATYSVPGIYPLSELTARTLASGLDTPSGDPSLLARLSDQVLVLKDFTTILEMSRQERQAILAQLREIYDGRFDKAWGTGKELHWRGRLGFLAGVTPVIDRHQAVLAVLGERFLQARIWQPDRLKVAEAAMLTVGREDEMREELARAVAGCLAGFDTTVVPEVPPSARLKLSRLADFTTRARSGVLRDGQRRDLDYAPEPEVPTRFARQLLSLLRGIAGTREGGRGGPDDLALLQRVALDCIPAQRRLVLNALVQGETDSELSTSEVAGKGRYSTPTIRRALEDCQALGLVSVTKQGQGHPDSWRLLDEWQETFSEMLEGGTSGDSPGRDEDNDSEAGQTWKDL